MRLVLLTLGLVALAVVGVVVARSSALAAVDESTLPARDRAKLDELTPRFRAKAAAVLVDLRREGIDYFLGDGFRSLEKSAELYAAHMRGGPRAAPPGSSAHNYAEGLDVNLRENGAVIQSVSHPHYQRFGAIVRKHGAVWGGDYKTGSPDGPHMEDPDWRELRDAAGKAVA